MHRIIQSIGSTTPFKWATPSGNSVPTLGKTWFFITADYAFGHALQAGVTGAITKAGATVVGSVRAPLGTTDFSSYVLQAQASKAEVVAIANGGDDAINAMKAVREFGLVAAGQKIVPFGLDSLPAIKSTTLEIANGGMYVTPWIPHLNAEADTFFAKFVERRKTAPSSFQVGTYSAVRSYLKAVEATNSTDPKIVIAKMRETQVKDAFTNQGTLRPDGRMVHDVYVVQIKSPAESKGEWDRTQARFNGPGRQGVSTDQRRWMPRFYEVSRRKKSWGPMGPREPP